MKIRIKKIHGTGSTKSVYILEQKTSWYNPWLPVEDTIHYNTGESKKVEVQFYNMKKMIKYIDRRYGLLYDLGSISKEKIIELQNEINKLNKQIDAADKPGSYMSIAEFLYGLPTKLPKNQRWNRLIKYFK